MSRIVSEDSEGSLVEPGTTEVAGVVKLTNKVSGDKNTAITPFGVQTAITELSENFKAFPIGTRMLFQQSSAPTGWVKEISTAYDNTAIRIVTTNTSKGGSVVFTDAFKDRSITLEGTTGATTLSVNQMPRHAHGIGKQTAENGENSWLGRVGSDTQFMSSEVGGSYSHTHPLSSASTTINLDVKYVDVIIATKQ